METLRDLFIKNNSFTAVIEINDKYSVYLEALDEHGGGMVKDFDEELLQDNILIELHEVYDAQGNKDMCDWNSDTIAEWYGAVAFHLDTTVDHIKEVMKYAIELYESEQEDAE